MTEQIKRCNLCGNVYPATTDYFHTEGDRRGLRGRCIQCYRLLNNERQNQHRRSASTNEFLKQALSTAKNRASRRGLHFSLSFDYILELWALQEGRCALTGDEMTTTWGEGYIETNVSIDRINPAGGYTPDNVQLVTHRANMMKSDMTTDELIEMCRKVLAKVTGSSIFLDKP